MGATAELLRENIENNYARFFNTEKFAWDHAREKLTVVQANPCPEHDAPGLTHDQQDRYWLSGKKFDVPVVEIPKPAGQLYSLRDLAGNHGLVSELSVIAQRFETDNHVLFAVHPAHWDELEKSSKQPNAGATWQGRGTSSMRTVSLNPKTRLKMHLPMWHDSITREIPVEAARTAVHVTSELLGAIAADSALQAVLAILPEPAAIIDHPGERANIVRVPVAQPRQAREETVCVHLYALGGYDLREAGDQTTLLERFISARPDPFSSAVDYYLSRIESPLFEGFWRLALRHGLVHRMAHGQNTFAELSDTGVPTGRIVFADLEDVLEATHIRRALNLPSFERRYGLAAEPCGLTLEKELDAVFIWFLSQTMGLIYQLRAAALRHPEIAPVPMEEIESRSQAAQSDILNPLLAELPDTLRDTYYDRLTACQAKLEQAGLAKP
ncbi:IucA/IucC family protein [Myxococcota bacterium]